MRSFAKFLIAVIQWAARAAWIVAGFMAGFVGLIYVFDRPETVLVGGVVPGRFVVAGLGLIGLAMLWRYAPSGRVASRAVGSGGWLRRSWAKLSAMPRFALIGALVAALTIGAFNPAKIGKTRVLPDADDPINLPTHVAAIRAQAAAIAREHRVLSRPVDFGSPDLDRLAEAELLDDRATRPTDQEWLDALRTLQPLNARLSEAETTLTNRVGEALIVISPRRPESGVAPYPIHHATVSNLWLCVDPKAERHSSQSKLIAYSAGNTASVAPYFLGVLRISSGVDPNSVVVRVTFSGGYPPVETKCCGWYRDTVAFRVAVPRDREILRVELPGLDNAPLALEGDIKLAERLIPVAVEPSLGTALAAAFPPIRSTPGEARSLDLNAGLGKGSVEWSLGPIPPNAAPDRPTLEIVQLPIDAQSKKEYVIAPRKISETALADVGTGGGTAGWPNLKTVAAPPGQNDPGEVLFTLERSLPREDGAPILLRRDPLRPHWVTVFIPSLDQLPLLEASQREAIGALLVIGSDVAKRGVSGLEPPTLDRYLVASDADRSIPLEIGPKRITEGLTAQLASALGGTLDGRPALTPSNTIKAEFALAAASMAAILIAISLLVSVAEYATRNRGLSLNKA